MESFEQLHSFLFDRGFNAGNSPLARDLEGYSNLGSSNALRIGEGYWRPWQGMDSTGLGAGSRIMKPVGFTWGGIKDDGATVATGTVSEEIGRSVWGIGSGQVHIAGTNITGFTLSTLLKLSLLASGVYQAPVTAGLAQPSAPSLGVTSSVGSPNGAISAKLERRRPSTGARSLASPTSNVIVPQANKVRVTFPAALAGQTHWRVYFTLMGFGGQGLHYATPYNLSLDITEAAVAAGTVDGITRSLEFDWKDGDLVPEEASFDDYSPPAATHHLRLENVMALAGAYADSVASPTSTNTGVAIAISKPNNYESYVPTHLLFLPEQVVDTLSRPIDSHGFIACQNSVHAIQYVGPREDNLPACTITTILQDVGIQYPHNWVQFRGRLAIYTAEGNLLIMSEDGSIDTEAAGKIRRFIADWAPADTVLGYDPKNDLLLMFNGRTCLALSLQNAQWSNPLYLGDYGITAGSVQSCQNAQRRLFVTVKNGSTFTAYEFDNAASANPVPVSFVSHYTNAPAPLAAKHLNQLLVGVETNSTEDIVVCLSRNLTQVGFRRITVSLSNNTVTSSDGGFTSAMLGKSYAIFGTNIGAGSKPYITGQIIAFTSSTSIDIGDSTGTPLSPLINASELLMFVGDYVAVGAPPTKGGIHLPDFFPNVPECKSFAFGAWFLTTDLAGSILEASVLGALSGTGRT